DMDDPAAAVGEAARVLRRGGALCCCITHPLETAGAFAARDADAPFIVDHYFDVRRTGSVHERGGIAIEFAKTHRPVAAYTGMVEDAGLVIEALRETGLPRELWRDETSARWARIPTFLHLRAAKT
ncbi:hypothetical protein, partial [Staphylococcus pseudintermedius]|uniref:hypothetical protein n=1 Tax=Staphylococcus pseudintermedius TaxID=283734 RepID=UPI002887A670